MKKFFTVIGVIVSVMFVFSLLGAFFGLSKFGSIQGTVTENSVLYLDLDGVIIDGKTFLENLRKLLELTFPRDLFLFESTLLGEL